jgi:SH3 domain-containing YSC84-like protein 1
MSLSRILGGFAATMSVAMFLPVDVQAADRADAAKRLKGAAEVLSDIMKEPEKGIPEDLITKAQCAVVVPSLKSGGFIVSGKYGKGFMTCRKPGGTGWSAPAAIRIEGGGVGFQIGGQETELVMLVMNDKGAEKLMSSEFTLGGEGAIAAGPVGRHTTAQTDAKFTAEILSWSKSRGIFAGVSLQGATLREDKEENQALYGKELGTKEVIATQAAPAEAEPLLHALAGVSVTEKK